MKQRTKVKKDGKGKITSKPLVDDISKEIKKLINALKDEEEYVRRRASEALGNVDYSKVEKETVEAAIEALINALKDENGDVRENAARALEGIINKMILEKLIEFTQSDVFLKLADNPSELKRIWEKNRRVSEKKKLN
ncbi:HEAT repeat domain-containing protein [Candidatus Micrarchaeota archaeon]|nr:HEAT repeat domain-containing protein [Candidatus Micrarchaeota archaeon]